MGAVPIAIEHLIPMMPSSNRLVRAMKVVFKELEDVAAAMNYSSYDYLLERVERLERELAKVIAGHADKGVAADDANFPPGKK